MFRRSQLKLRGRWWSGVEESPKETCDVLFNPNHHVSLLTFIRVLLLDLPKTPTEAETFWYRGELPLSQGCVGGASEVTLQWREL